MAYDSLQVIQDICEKENISFFEVILRDDIEERKVTRQDSLETMYQMWDAMVLAAASYEPSLKSASGLVGGQGEKMEAYRRTGACLSGDFISRVIAQALQMGESNACMKRIVAAPTAGACGVLPAVLIPYFRREAAKRGEKEQKALQEAIIESLYVAAGIGQVIASRAYIAGAAGGCQAEIGSASSMAAGALVALQGGTAAQICDAAAMALKNLLGLVCDPVAGLVEVPCVKRNVIGAVGAVAAADMALAGIVSAIPADQVFDAMKEVGDKMHASLRETGEGGLAATPAGCRITKSVIME